MRITRACVLMGSPRTKGNTAELCKPIIEELRLAGVETEYIELAGKTIAPCKGCYRCQEVPGAYGCPQQDDMLGIIEAIQRADLLVFATPIYTWQATAPMKAVMDRMYGLNKYYGSAPRECLNAHQRYALLATCGYAPSYGADLLSEAIQRWSKHSGIPYLGMYAVRDTDNLASFQTKEAIEGAKAFARSLLEIPNGIS